MLKKQFKQFFVKGNKPMTSTLSILRPKQAAARLGVSVAMVWNKCNPKSRHFDAAFPQPFKLAARATGWLESEINDYIAHLAAQRGDSAKKRRNKGS